MAVWMESGVCGMGSRVLVCMGFLAAGCMGPHGQHAGGRMQGACMHAGMPLPEHGGMPVTIASRQTGGPMLSMHETMTSYVAISPSPPS